MKRGRAPASGGSCQSGQLTLTAFGNGGSVDIRAAGVRHSLSAFTRPADAFWGGQPIHGLAVVPGLRWAFAPCSPPLQPYDLRDATLATLVHLDRRWQGKAGTHHCAPGEHRADGQGPVRLYRLRPQPRTVIPATEAEMT